MVFGKDCKGELKGREEKMVSRKKFVSKRRALTVMVMSVVSLFLLLLGIRYTSTKESNGAGGMGVDVGVDEDVFASDSAEDGKEGNGVSVQGRDYSKLSGWKYIIIHHSAIEIGDKERYEKYHKTKYKSVGLLYHFVIGNGYGDGTADGKIEISEAWRHQERGGHVSDAYYDKHSIGIVLVGNFNKHKPTKRQLASLRVLVQYLMGKFKIGYKNVLMHKEVTATECPGAFFPKQAFMREIRNISVISKSSY